MGRWHVVAGGSPIALGAPGTQLWVGARAVPKLGGKLPPSTAKLAVPPGSICMVPAGVISSVAWGGEAALPERRPFRLERAPTRASLNE